MRFEPKIYTVESVTSGHPDKVCDQISDAVLDECLRQDPTSRVGVEVMGSHGLVVIGGEVTTRAKVDYEAIARQIHTEVGYSNVIEVKAHVSEQAPEIARGVDTGGAGDQGIMYGYATSETPEFLPRGVVLAHALARRLEQLRTVGEIIWLKPDGKTQVTAENGRTLTVLVSAQHTPEVGLDELRSVLTAKLIAPLVQDMGGIEVLVNPTGTFTSGGFEADAGLTGRKIMVDTYGGLIPHGGGCFSGKDPTKVDRSGAYMCRFVAKNLVAAGLGKECLVSVAYAIGRAEPLMVEAVNEKQESLSDYVRQRFDFRPQAIIERLGLRRPLYRATATYGHFGKAGLPWEELVVLG
ncbi:MAG: methionine adenosyltransferase [Candidatus Veblenbacteria bacterium]|nr:methionine adenosyltransferase [Candidatus Veblenbacteria bacterium]